MVQPTLSSPPSRRRRSSGPGLAGLVEGYLEQLAVRTSEGAMRRPRTKVPRGRHSRVIASSDVSEGRTAPGISCGKGGCPSGAMAITGLNQSARRGLEIPKGINSPLRG
jgi:hypothetical protein